MTVLSNVVESPTLEQLLSVLAAQVATLREQNEELERLGSAIVDNAQGDVGAKLVGTRHIDNLAACLTRIKRSRVTA